MQDNCFIENSFIKDIGFHHIKEWLSSNCNCEENKDYFNNLSPIYNISKLNNELLHTEELFKGLCRKDSLIEAAYELTSSSGKTVCVGIPKKQFKAKIDTFQLHFEKEISGSHGGSSNPSYVIPRYINLFHKKKINIKKQILNKFSLDKINIAIKHFRSGSPGRIVIKF